MRHVIGERVFKALGHFVRIIFYTAVIVALLFVRPDPLWNIPFGQITPGMLVKNAAFGAILLGIGWLAIHPSEDAIEMWGLAASFLIAALGIFLALWLLSYFRLMTFLLERSGHEFRAQARCGPYVHSDFGRLNSRDSGGDGNPVLRLVAIAIGPVGAQYIVRKTSLGNATAD